MLHLFVPIHLPVKKQFSWKINTPGQPTFLRKLELLVIIAIVCHVRIQIGVVKIVSTKRGIHV